MVVFVAVGGVLLVVAAAVVAAAPARVGAIAGAFFVVLSVLDFPIGFILVPCPHSHHHSHHLITTISVIFIIIDTTWKLTNSGRHCVTGRTV